MHLNELSAAKLYLLDINQYLQQSMKLMVL